MNQYLHEVAITAIIVKDDKFLITRRSKTKKRFPGKWTVPGGRLQSDDYINLSKDSNDYWYNAMERTLEREVMEETGLEIQDVQYLTSLAGIHDDGTPSLVISCIAKYLKGKIKLQEEETDDFAWVNVREAKKYDLIDGIYDELVMANQKIKGKKVVWKRF